MTEIKNDKLRHKLFHESKFTPKFICFIRLERLSTKILVLLCDDIFCFLN